MSTIQQFAELVESQQKERMLKEYPNIQNPGMTYQVTIKTGKKYTKIDVGQAGKFMVDQNWNIFGIKAYCVIHKGHFYGTLDAINKFYWGNYSPQRISEFQRTI